MSRFEKIEFALGADITWDTNAAVSDLRWAVAEIKRLQAIVDKLPKTADGVPVVPGMVLYSSAFICGAFRHPETVKGMCAYADPDTSGWMDGELDVHDLYSTQEAAEAEGK